MKDTPPVIGFAAWSGTGKTTLISKLLPIFKQHNVSVGIIKHTHHNVEFDTPGKDSHRLRTAGANQVLVTSAKRWALYGDKTDFTETLNIDREISRLNTSKLDLVLVESFKTAPIAKIELHRPSMKKPLLYPNDVHIVAIASDTPIQRQDAPAQLSINQPMQIARYIIDTFLV